MAKKRVLFISALDFKEKSIQVIRKTPEFFVKSGWEVDYLVARDSSSRGNYYYENEVHIDGVSVDRFYWPFPRLRSINVRIFSLVFEKIISFYLVLLLFFKARLKIRSKSYDVVYGYELHGALAAHLLSLIHKKSKLVTRFQGTFLYEMKKKKQYLRLLYNLDLILAIYLNSDLIIMTNDGTQGDRAVQWIKGDKAFNMFFWVNGVDIPRCSYSLTRKNECVLLSVSRLVQWKRVDRCLKVVYELKKKGFDNFVYYIVGEGGERLRLEEYARKLDVQDNVCFVGAIKHDDLGEYYLMADVFLSMYDSSNVGNPLLEAIRNNKLIVTLKNGDTGDWIEHWETGLIYDESNFCAGEVASDLASLLSDEGKKNKLREKLKEVESAKLWTWDERLSCEVESISALVEGEG